MFINSIPDDVLHNVFSMIPREFLVTNVQHVCKHWMAVCRNWRLWKNFVYTPDRNTTCHTIIRFLKQAPALKSFALAGLREPDLLIDALIKYTPDLRKVKLISHVCFSHKQIDKILTGLPLLEYLHLNLKIDCDTKAMALIRQSPSLKTLDIGRHTIEDGDKKLEWKFRIDSGNTLENITITYNKGQEVSIETLTYLIDFKKDALISLTLGIPDLSQQYLNQIGRCSKLTSLHICNNNRVKFRDFENMTWLKNFSTLKHLSLNNFANGIDEIISVNSWYHLMKLNLILSNIGEYTVRAIIEGCPNLSYLGLSLTNMASRSLKDIHKLVNLEEINVEKSYCVTDETVKDVARCSKLCRINLNGCRLVTDEALTFLLQCYYLKVLRICCPRVTGHHFKLLPHHLPSLELLEVCLNGKTEQRVINLFAKMPKLRIESQFISW